MIHRDSMPFSIKGALTAVLILCFCLSNARSENVEIAVDESNPPFMYRDVNTGEADGLYPVIVKALFEKIGVNVAVAAYPWKRLLLLSEAGEVGVAGIYKNSKRILVYDYSDSIFDERILVFMKADSAFPFERVEDLKDKRIGVVRGWSYGDAFDYARKQNEFYVDSSISDELNFKKLALGRLDCVLAIDHSGRMLLQKLELQDEIVASNIPLLVNPTYIVFAKESNKSELILKLNEAMANMKADGTYEQIINSTLEQELLK